MADDAAADEGVVLSASARHAVVLLAGREQRCTFRKDLFRSADKRFNRPVVAGDRVRVSVAPASEPIIEEVRRRRNWLSRGKAGSDGEQLMVANPDRMVIVSAALEPGFRPRLVDRLLAAAERADVPAFVAVNKADLLQDRAEIEEWIALYRRLGYEAGLVSAVTGEGIEALRAFLGPGITVVAGQSGVGKSSLASALLPGLELKVAPVTEATGKGRHTTTTVTLHPIGEGAFLADSPGVRSFALAEPPGPDLGLRFREFAPFIDECRFRDCLHLDEPACAVRDARDRGAIDARRFDSYQRIIRGDDSDVPADS